MSAQIRDWRLFHRGAPFDSIAPHLQLENLKATWSYPRGLIDGIALRLRYSDSDLHKLLSPTGMVESLIFEVLEQLRVESICPKSLKGSRQNIQTQFMSWTQQFIATGGVEGSIGLLLITVFSTVWMKLNGQEMPHLIQDIVESTRAGIADSIGHLLVALKKYRQDQTAYSKVSIEVVRLVAQFIEEEYRDNPSIRSKRKKQSSSLLQIEWIPPNTEKNQAYRAVLGQSSYEKNLYLRQALNNYHVYDDTYDIEIEAQKKIRPAQLAIYQEDLNKALSSENIPWAKLTRHYQQLFSTRIYNKWRVTEAEGLIDRRYLIRAATSPLQPILHKQPYQYPKPKAKFTLLIDCSGSMKEQRIQIACCVDALVRILDQAHIQTEVLGYSTRAWQGGRPFKAWKKNGQEANPGRLNERAHWIFKNFHTSWRRSRSGIAALLRPEIYTESVDGEALLWAAERLQKSDVGQSSNKKLILFSDGCPMDRATIEANGDEFLKNHLLKAIAWCEQQHLELWGCGIGEELRPYFQNRLSWTNDAFTLSKTLQHWAYEFKTTSMA
ncbi:cobaltochelatase CobT-related protein [Polynucleobacter brandtiae]